MEVPRGCPEWTRATPGRFPGVSEANSGEKLGYLATNCKEIGICHSIIIRFQMRVLGDRMEERGELYARTVLLMI